MKLITGGAFQGKLAFAQKQYHCTDGWLDGADCPLPQVQWENGGDVKLPGPCKGIYHFHEYIRRMLEQGCLQDGTQAASFAESLYRENPELIIVTSELGCGIVPMDPFDRAFRETSGRICTCLAAKSEEVVRVICGIGTRIK